MNHPNHASVSLTSKFMMLVLRLMNIKGKGLARVKAGKGINDVSSDAPEPDTQFRSKHHVEKTQVNGRNVFTLSPLIGSSDAHILYLHGGCYSATFIKEHWQFMGYLMDQCRCAITAPDYPLLPSATYRDTFAMVEQVYRDMTATVVPDKITFMGDSAGGGLALALAQKLALEHAPQPHQLILLSPWLDISMTNPDIWKVADRDPLVSAEACLILARQYAGNSDLSYYQLSPIYGDLTGLGNVSVFTGAIDVLNPDARKLKGLFEAQQITFQYFEYPHMMHDWILFPLPESMQARRQILDLLGHW